jgi:hypothetical protein
MTTLRPAGRVPARPLASMLRAAFTSRWSEHPHSQLCQRSEMGLIFRDLESDPVEQMPNDRA